MKYAVKAPPYRPALALMNPQMDSLKVSLYTPSQTILAAFFGFPLAGLYVLWKNFNRLGRKDRAHRTFIWGTSFSFLALVSVPFLPDWFPLALIPCLFTGVVFVAVQKFQISKKAIKESGHYQYQADLHVVALVASCAVVTATVYLLWTFLLENVGLLTITD